MDYAYIKQRITDKRIEKGVSEYQMSLDLGHSRSYMQNISSGRSKPSIEEFLYICDYLGTTPGDFFDEKNQEPILIQKALSGMRSLTDKELIALINLIDLFNANRKNAT